MLRAITPVKLYIVNLSRFFKSAVFALLLLQVSQAAYATLAITSPATVNSTDADGNFTLSWTGSASYMLITETINGVSQTFYGTSSGGAGSLAISGRAPGIYYYHFQNYCGGGQYSSPTACDYKDITVAVGNVPPPTPTLRALLGAGYIALSWDKPAGTVSFQLSRGGATLPLPGPSATSYNDTSVAPGTTYTYALKACNAVGMCSTSAATATITYPAIPSVTSFSAVVSGSTVAVNWTTSATTTSVKLVRDSTTLATSGTTYTDSGISAGASYTYYLTACNAVRSCSATASTTVNVAAIPLAPTVTANFGGATATVSWTTPSSTSTFQVQRNGSNVPFSGTSYYDNKLVQGTSYTYAVKACNVNGLCSPAGSAGVVVPSGILFEVRVTGNNTLSILAGNVYSWNPQESTNNGATWVNLEGGAASSGTPSQLNFTRPGGTYKYRLYNCYPTTDGCSTSADKTITLVGSPPPAVPIFFAPTVSSSSIAISWIAPAGAVSYKVTRNGAPVTPAPTGAAYTDNAVTAGGTYVYTVRACNATGECSAAASVTSGLPPVTPALTVPVSSSKANYDVKWTAAAGAVDYILTENGADLPRTAALIYSPTKSNGTYTYQIRACNAFGCGTPSPISKVDVAVVGQMTEIVAVLNQDTAKPTLKWNPVTGATKYEVRYWYTGLSQYSSPDSAISLGFVTTNNPSFAAIPSLTPTYTYWVSACASVGSVTNCNWQQSNSVSLVAPDVPVIVSPSTNATGEYAVSWRLSLFATRYELYENGVRSYGESLFYKAFTGATKKVNGTYKYKVKACRALCSKDSNEVTTVVTISAPSSSRSSSSVASVSSTGGSGNTFSAPSGGGDVYSTLLTGPNAYSPAPTDVPQGPFFVGSLKGQFRVNETGAATYNVPIAVADGIAGVKPSVSVDYNSQGGNGLLGKGWSLSGASQITRCRQTLSQDGAALPLTWNGQDRFCLNGQRLMLVSGTTYGSANSTYRTELESAVVVTAYGGTAGNPDYFDVKAKDGSTSRYGSAGTVNSEVNARDATGAIIATKILTWNLSRFEDSVGNPIIYTYETDANYNVLTNIEYACTAKQQGSCAANIQFKYIDRTDLQSGYIAGHLFKNNKLLKKIISSSDGEILRTYELYYELTPERLGSLNRVQAIQECVDALSCYPATYFKWFTPKAPDNWLYGTKLSGATSTETMNNFTLLDINGNGMQDYVWGTGFYSLDGLKSKFFSITAFVTYSRAGLKFKPIDFNGDGHQDVLVYNPAAKKWAVKISVYNNQEGWILGGEQLAPFTDENIIVGDIDSDGLADVIEAKTGDSALTVYRVIRNTSAALTHPTHYYMFAAGVRYAIDMANYHLAPIDGTSVLADFNGDGRVDLGINTAESIPYQDDGTGYSGGYDVNNYAIYTLSSINTFQLNTTIRQGGDVLGSRGSVLQSLTVDVNGDGLSDIAYLQDYDPIKKWFYRINTGAGFNAPVMMLDKDGVGLSDNKSVLFADLNRDGYPDLTWRQTVGSNTFYKPLFVRYWNPVLNNFGAVTQQLDRAESDTTLMFGDANGDSWPDVITYGVGAISTYAYANSYDEYSAISSTQTPVLRPDTIEEITDGLGNVTSLKYEPLARSKHYLPIGDVKVAGETFTQCHPQYSTPSGIVPAGCTTTTAYSPIDFYRQVHAPFDCSLVPANADWLDACAGRVDTTAITDASGVSIRDSAVLEITGPVPIVTRVESTAPSAGATPGSVNTTSKSAVEYLYKRMRMQAKGRGGLGFGYVASVDMQSGIISETAYRQDWPFIGAPFKTRVKTGDGKLLSLAENTMDVKLFGSSTAKRFLPFVAKSTETSYGLNADGTTSLLQTVTTDTILDGTNSLSTTGVAYENALYVHGNPRVITVTTEGAGEKIARETTNTYYTDDVSQKTARLQSSKIKTTRNGSPEQDAEKTVSFTYYSSGVQKGLLQTETLEAGTVNQLVTETVYDDWGNKTKVSVTGKATATRNETRNTFYAYANGPRYLTSTTNDLQQSAAVVARNKFGTATTVTDVNAIEARSYTDAMGQEYLRTDATGAWSRTDIKLCNQSLSGVNVVCPTTAYYYKASRVAGGGTAIEYFDRLGRVIRAGKVGFDGKWVYSDTEYDSSSRVVHQSTPFVEGTAPFGWTKTQYDLVGRVDKVSTPDGTHDGAITTSGHTGYDTLVTNDLGHTRTETRNGLGQLIKVKDHLNGIIDYEYNFNGDLLSATTTAADVVGSIKVRMCYDKLGRKAGMYDPDKGGFASKGNAATSCSVISSWQTTGVTQGWWLYAYNAFGELIEQRDPKGQRNLSEYDRLGRLIKRDDFRTGNALEAHTRWFYDTAMDGSAQVGAKGKLTATVMSANGSETCIGSNHCTLNTYDQYARPSNSLVMYPNDTTGYVSSVDYDSIGRAYQSHDGLKGAVFGESGVQTQYNAYGYAYRSIDMVPRDGSKGVLSEIKEMNAWGKVTKEFRGNGLTSISEYNVYTGMLKHQKTMDALGINVVQENTYGWDSVGNLNYRWSQSAKLTSGRKDLKEGFCYDGLNRLIATLPTVTPNCNGVTQDITYNGFGNITFKKGVGTGTYLYDGVSGGPHAVTSAGGIAYRYDANGNAISGDNRDFTYTSYDMASKISKGPLNSAEFKYGPDRGRWQRIDIRNGVATTTTYIGNLERIQVGTSSVVEWKRTVAGVVLTYKTSGNTLQSMDKRYVYSDHLGSVDIITGATGSISHSLSFDPWGARRGGEDWSALTAVQREDALEINAAAIFAQPVTTRGFTGHEMVDDMGIIHMNGRIYDAKLGRFLQADPHVDGAANTQGYNRYSYVHNNPLNATDPSGFFSLRQFVGVVVAVIATIACDGYVACGEAAYVWIGALAGGAQAAANGGNILQGIVLGAFTGAAGGTGWTNFFARGFIGGVSSLVMGGKFGHGFISAGVGGAIGGSAPIDYAARAIVGGTISEMTGGKFANGAASAVISYLITTGIEHFDAGGGSCYEVSSSCSGPLKDDHGFEKPNKNFDLEVIDDNGVKVIRGHVKISGDKAKAAADQINDTWGSGRTYKYNGQKYRTEITAEAVSTGGQITITQLQGNELAQAKLDYIAKVLQCNPASGLSPSSFQLGGRAAYGGTSISFGDGLGKYTFAHEFGHLLGLHHAPDSTGSIMSYAGTRKVLGKDVYNLVNGYD